MKKLLIVDGHNLLFQMFYGMPSKIINKDGKAIQGTLGFIGAFIKIIKMTKPTHVIVLFDGEHENDRAELNAEYKANRIDYSTVADEDSPFSQIDDVYKALDYMNICHFEENEYETDDVIASYAIKYAENTKIIISSFDSDFFQLINDNVAVLRYRGKNTLICDDRYVQDKYGITASQYAYFKSLTGDSADNIKGVDKVGVKTAAELINEFGNLENIISNSENIKKPSIRENVIKSTERIRTNYKLIKLTSRARLPFEIDELIYNYDGITTTEVLRGIGIK